MEQPAPIAPPPGYGNVLPEDDARFLLGGDLPTLSATTLADHIGRVMTAVTDLNAAVVNAIIAANSEGVGLDVVLKGANMSRISFRLTHEHIGATVAVIHGGR